MYGTLIEFLCAQNHAAKFELVMAACAITLLPLTPASCIEYVFAEEPDNWKLAQISADALEHYKKSKFQVWRDMLMKPDCEASLRRVLQIGIITQIFDASIFPTPSHLLENYHVKNEETGKIVKIPHPVAKLRSWDLSSQSYLPVDPHLNGAPEDKHLFKKHARPSLFSSNLNSLIVGLEVFIFRSGIRT